MARSSLSKAGFILGIATATGALAQGSGEQAASAASSTLSVNLGVVSQYRYRGIMQTNNNPAVQGGVDWVHASGFYVGNWNSSISWLRDSDHAVSAPVEMDFYGGYTGKVWGDLSIDAGVLQYYYPGRYPDGYTSPNTTEAYLGFGYGPVTFKYSHALSNLFGFADSKNSQYYDLKGSFATGVWGLMLDPHVGYQRVRNLTDGSYMDWSLGLSKTFDNGLKVSVTYIDTNAKTVVYTNPQGRHTGRATGVLSLSASF